MVEASRSTYPDSRTRHLLRRRQVPGSPVDEASGSPVNEASGSPVNEASGSPVYEASGSPVNETSGFPVNETSGSSVVHAEGSEEWTLVVRYAQQRDSAVYECQVNTDPKLSRPVTLNVLSAGRGEVTAPKAPKVFVANNTASTKDGHLRVEIQGARELYIEEGSSLSLTCLVTSSKGPSTPVYWYHDTNLIDYNSPRGGVNLKIDQGRGETTTRLVVSAVGPGDSGMYSCVPPGSHPATVLVHVQKGEHEAAIQQGGLDEAASASSQVASSSLIILLILLIFSTYLLDLLDQFMAHSLPSYTSLSFICFCSTYFLSSLAFSSPRDAVCRWISHLLGRLQHLS
nr:uncharacterized protein LOC123770596 [Procambarus clarkii]